MKKLEMWAGLECTLNRVQDRYINQEDKNGHDKRLSFDLAKFAELGVGKIRYPCLWELVAPERGIFKWSELDFRLPEMRRLGISFIAGFLHHGSGPRYTSLIDEEFPEKIEEYAAAFAERYPWVEDYTPINEINTTARFSLLYGHWYPHHKMDHMGYVRSVFLQVKGTILCMRAIRKVNPDARLIQTDDLGFCQSTEPLKGQCDFENERRWLSWDMLCGKMTPDYPLIDFIRRALSDEEISWLQENACPPDVIGVNHYLLSNRFLDHRKELYAKEFEMDNGKRVYADLGAIDSGLVDPPSPEFLMRQTWERYHLPIAITEVHTMGPRDAQMKWLYEVWRAGEKVREEGVDLRAITVWSLLGTYDWNKLCTVCDLFYEPGVFDLRSPDKKPRHTAVSSLVKELAEKGSSEHPILQTPGWWKTPRRIRHNPAFGLFSPLNSGHRPVVITGGGGTLGQAFARICGSKNIPYQLLRRSELDIAELSQVREVLARIRPWALINAAGYVNVDKAEEESGRCFRENVEGASNLAIVCSELGIPLVSFSTDLVFDGLSTQPYHERDLVNPLNVYGLSKAQSEKKVLETHERSLVIRTSSFFGPWDEHNFVIQTLRNLVKNSEVMAAKDLIISPTYVPDLVDATFDMLLDEVTGLVHLTNDGELTWAEFAQVSAEMGRQQFQIDPARIVPGHWSDIYPGAKRPRNSALVSERFSVLPKLEDAIGRYFHDLEENLVRR